MQKLQKICEYCGKEIPQIVKAIKIDVETKTVSIIDFEPVLDNYYKEINCDIMTVAVRLGNSQLLVDDNGMLKPNKYFTINYLGEDAPQPYAGNGVITGTDECGDEIDTDVTLEQITIEFLN